MLAQVVEGERSVHRKRFIASILWTSRVFACLCPLALTAVSSDVAKAADFRGAAKSINDTIRANYFHPAALDKDAYRQMEKDVIALGETAVAPDEFISGFNGIWRKRPVFHVGPPHPYKPAAVHSSAFYKT